MSLLQATFSVCHPTPPVVEELVLVPLHAAPEAAVTEIDSLYDVYQDVKDRWGATVSASLGRAPGPLPLQHKAGELWAGGTVAIHPGARRTCYSFPWQDALLLGDFNADCNYVQAEDWPSIRLRSSKDFQWLIPDTADTTVTNTICAYDRWEE